MVGNDLITIAPGGSITIYVGTNSTVGGNGVPDVIHASLMPWK